MVIWEEETHGFGRMQRELRKARGLRRRRRVQPPDHGTHRHRHRRLCEGRAGGAARGAGRRPPAGSGTLDAWVSSAGGVVLVGWCPGVCGRVHAWAVWLCWLLKFFLGLRLGWALELGPCGTF